MFRPALGAVGRILLRGQATAARSLSRPAGASRLRHLHSQQSNVGDAAATAGHRFGFLRRSMKLAAWSGYVGFGVWTCMKVADRIQHDFVSSVVPSEIDWVKAGVVSPVVRKQNGCGSCWAMVAAASVEALHYMKTLKSISLSVQELIDCDTESHGCQGGHEENAFRYISKNGLSSESDYPYMARRSKSGCKRNKTAAAIRISGFRFVNPTEDALEKAVAKRPVVVTLQFFDDLYEYKGGILDCKAVNGKTDRLHPVLIVGYGTDSNGIKYWRFKNSWGPNWGEKGFGRIRRHVDDKRGVLGIFMEPGVYRVLED
ncbi:hypothetical protein CFC21_019882 [Triticum aestivum]|uniref:Peptidase C1A papain C-terminal domain-containing protein n=2 Tax=Triticum aestivum TaxID=4565 RepID=A0A9R1J572_WHEAT|nr:ervatamin-B-like [Triticum aestivum]KAF7004685.1 hypothetical protein CFC21_019882 [Triticum aestivum]